MATEYGTRRAEIMAFLKGLSPREKLVVLSFLSNDAAIYSRVPDLARSVLDMHRSYHKMELLQLVETEHTNLNLEFLARRKGCRLERVVGVADRWRILRAHDRGVGLSVEADGQTRRPLTVGQALEALRALPERPFSARS